MAAPAAASSARARHPGGRVRPDADKLDMLLQALEYREAGWQNLDPFIQTAVSALRTPSGRRLGEAAMLVSPAAWWQGFARGVPKISPGSLNGG